MVDTKDDIIDGELPKKTFEKSSIFRASGAVSLKFRLEMSNNNKLL